MQHRDGILPLSLFPTEGGNGAKGVANPLLERLAQNAHQSLIEGKNCRNRMGGTRKTTEKN